MKFLSFASLVVLILTQTSAQARKSDGKVHTSVNGDQVVSRLDQGYHFNKEAPASLKSADGQSPSAPVKKEEDEIVFKTGQLDKKNFSVNFYVCDDAKTVCEEHTKKFVNNREVNEIASANVEKNVTAPKTSAKSAVNKNGFIEDNLAAATLQANSSKKLILVDFRAPWCPACIRLETEVFPQATFKKAAASLVKLSINIDRDENKEIAKKYGIKAIPTLIVMDAAGNEIYRSLDYKPTALLAAELNKITNGKNVSYDSLRLEAEAGSKKAMATLGLHAYMSMDFAEAVKWLAPLKTDRRLFANSEVSYWSEQIDTDPKALRTYTDTLEKWIAAFPETYEAIVWRNELADKLTKKDQPVNADVAKVLEANVVQVKKILASAKEIKNAFDQNYVGDYSGFEKTELNFQLVTTYSLLKRDDAKESAQKATYAELQKIKLGTARPGEVLMAVSYLRQLNKKAEAQAWLEKLVKTYPDTYVYYSKLAHFFYGEKDYTRALPLAQKAVDLDTSVALKNLQFLAEVQKALNQKQEAAQTIERALALPEAKLAHNKKIADSLLDFKKTLQ